MKTMKMTLFLAAAAAALTLSAQEATFRVDVDGMRQKIALEGEPSDTMSAEPMSWISDADKQACTVLAQGLGVAPKEWEEYSFSFTPEKAGTVFLLVKSQNDPGEPRWVLVNSIKMNGALVPNGDFKVTTKKKGGKLMPRGFVTGVKATYLPTAGANGTPAMLLSHDNYLGFNLPVEAGKSYKLSFQIKDGSAELAK